LKLVTAKFPWCSKKATNNLIHAHETKSETMLKAWPVRLKLNDLITASPLCH
jgi:hypothetical protein